MSLITCRTMLYKAIRRSDGRHVVIDPSSLQQTTKIVDNDGDYLLAKSLGWCSSPQEALDRLEADEAEQGVNAAIRAYDDRRMSPEAQAEAEAVESRSMKHLAEIPEAPKKRGRPRKSVVQ